MEVYVPEGKGVILFDGVCNVCNEFVNFVVDRDEEKHFMFASLQSEKGQKLCERFGIPLDLNTMVLIEGDEHFIKSTAALRVLSRLNAPWPLLFYSLICIPSFIRDTGYSIFAANRYRLFGKNESCRMMTPDLKARFLEYATAPPRPAAPAQHVVTIEEPPRSSTRKED